MCSKVGDWKVYNLVLTDMLRPIVRDYHKKYYVPHNLSLIVTGKLSSGTESLLSVVQDQIEPNIIAHGQNQGPRPADWKRPFLETESAQRRPIAKVIKETVEFPEKDESMGELIISFMGPAPSEFLERKALDVIGTYLTSSPVAPLNKEYVEIESPLWSASSHFYSRRKFWCIFSSSYIYFSEDSRATLCDITIYIGSVPTEHLDTFDTRFRASLERIVKDDIDMERMAMIISRDERQVSYNFGSYVIALVTVPGPAA